MKPTDTSERELENLIVRHLTGIGEHSPAGARAASDARGGYAGGRYVLGRAADYNRDVALDVAQLLAFLQSTQPEAVETLGWHRRASSAPSSCTACRARSPSAVWWMCSLRKPSTRTSSASPGRCATATTRQLAGLVVFINGLPVLTFELKNSLTKQTVADAIVQYQTTRNPRELLFQMGRCVAHFAVDDVEVRFCTELKGKASWFLPFNRAGTAARAIHPTPTA
jgi:type I restriction enzyme R subunit